MDLKGNSRRDSTRVIGILIIIILLFSDTCALAASRELLWGIINNCLDTTAFDYCKVCGVTRTDSICTDHKNCEAQIEIWSESYNYVAMRDHKMCGCPDGFVHGLAIPRAHITGVEDLKRPLGIWEFAWNCARKRISSEQSIALVVNPAQHRSQDQLHVHIVRLKNGARQHFTKLSIARIESLDQVWNVALIKAKEQQFDDYGVLVVKHPDGGYLVLIDQESIEYNYTEATCH